MHWNTNNGTTQAPNDKGQEITIANFTAKIVEERLYHDGARTEREYVIQGWDSDGNAFGEIVVDQNDFPSMGWVAREWGSKPIIFPRTNAKELLRTIIQLNSDPKVSHVYRHTGWANLGKTWTYISNGCAIDGKRRRGNVKTDLPADLSRIALPFGEQEIEIPLQASLALPHVTSTDVGWLVLAAIYRAALGKCDFCVHITGRTGTFKSELASLAQSHFGMCDSRQLPGTWSSTANALEALAFRAKDCLFTIDDFIPAGSSYQQKAYQSNADRIFRAAGNQAGRARLNDTSRHQQTMFPRGLVLSTGEDTPEGHSVRGRAMIAELSPGDIDGATLSNHQANRELYPHAMAGFIQHVARDYDAVQARVKQTAKDVRDNNRNVGHTRTPHILGQLIAGLRELFLFVVASRTMSRDAAHEQYVEGQNALGRIAHQQQQYLVAADPADQFVTVLRNMFSAHQAHAKTPDGGIPYSASQLGWSVIGDGSMGPDYKPHGVCLGWASRNEGILYLDASLAFDQVRKHSRGSVTIGANTMYKRLKEAGHLAKVDSTRQRNTVRMTAQGATRQCLALQLESVLQEKEH